MVIFKRHIFNFDKQRLRSYFLIYKIDIKPKLHFECNLRYLNNGRQF